MIVSLYAKLFVLGLHSKCMACMFVIRHFVLIIGTHLPSNGPCYGLKGLYFKELKSVTGNTCCTYGPYIFSVIICFCMPCYGGEWESRSILCLFDDFITRV